MTKERDLLGLCHSGSIPKIVDFPAKIFELLAFGLEADSVSLGQVGLRKEKYIFGAAINLCLR